MKQKVTLGYLFDKSINIYDILGESGTRYAVGLRSGIGEKKDGKSIDQEVP